MTERRCSKCGTPKEPARKNCRPCGQRQNRKYRTEHKEAINARVRTRRIARVSVMRLQQRESYRRNASKAIARAKAWKKANPQKAKKLARKAAQKQRILNRDVLLCRTRQWRDKAPDKYLIALVNAPHPLPSIFLEAKRAHLKVVRQIKKVRNENTIRR